LLYTFKAKVEMASPDSVVAIDKHTVPYKLKSGRIIQKEYFRELLFVSKLAAKAFWMVAGLIWPWMQQLFMAGLKDS
jgi:hypothetical protein